MKIIDPYRFATSGYATDYSILLNDGGLANEYINLGNVLDEDASSAFSISCWIRMKGASSTNHAIWHKYGSNIGVRFYIASDEKPVFQLRNASTQCTTRINTAINTSGSWVHLVYTYDGSKDVSGHTGYYDAVSQGLFTLGNTLSLSTSNSVDAHISDSTMDFQGNIAALEKWNKELTGAEVTELYNSGTPIDPETHSASANLEACWRFGDVSGDDATGTTGTIQDTVGGFNGTPINTVAGDIVLDAP